MTAFARSRHQHSPRRFEGLDPLEARVLLANVLWTGAGDGTSWDDGANWSTSAVPQPGDDVTIDVAGSPMIVKSGGSINVNSILSREAMRFGGSQVSLAVDAASTFWGPVDFNVNLGGAGTVAFNGLARVRGFMGGTGRTVIGSGGVLELSGGLEIQRRVDNIGAINNRDNQINIDNPGVLNNFAGGVVNLTSTSFNPLDDHVITGDGVFNNAGGLFFHAPHQREIAVRLNNSGVVDVRSGTLELTNSSNTHSGVFFIRSGATLLAHGGIFGMSSLIRGLGTLRVVSGPTILAGTIDKLGTLDVRGDVEVSGSTSVVRLEMVCCTLSGSADIFILSSLRWVDGVMEGSGRTIITSLASGELAADRDTGSIQLYRTLLNNGSLRLENAYMTFSNGTLINNNSSTFEMEDARISYESGTSNVFINKGVFESLGGDNRFHAGDGGVIFNSTGTVHVRSGALSLLGGVAQVVGSTLLAGTWNVWGGQEGQEIAVLHMPANIRTNQATIALRSSEASMPALHGLTSNQGPLALLNGAEIVVIPIGSSFTNRAALTLGVGSHLFVVGQFTQTGAGTLVVQTTGASPDRFGRLETTGASILGGRVRFDFFGWTPAIGTQFNFITSSARVGTFATVQSTGLPATRGIMPIYSGTGVTMRVTA